MANIDKPLSKMAGGSKSHTNPKSNKVARKSTESHLPPDATAESIMLLDQLASELSSTTFEVSKLEPLLRKYKHAVRLLGLDEGWVSRELDGYPKDEDVPSHRVVRGQFCFVSSKYESILSQKRSARIPLHLPVGGMLSLDLSSEKKEYHFYLGEPRKATISGTIYNEAQGVGLASTIQIRGVLHKISELLFDRISKDLITLKFGKVVESIFKQYQRSVDKVVTELGVGDYLQTAYQGLARDDEASWQSAALACRTMIKRLADTLWQDPGEYYPYMKNKDGSGLMRVTNNEPRNRLRAYLQQKEVKGDSMLAAMLDPLYAMASAGKAPITYEHTQRVVIHTYIFVGELVTQTDMQPVMEVHKV